MRTTTPIPKAVFPVVVVIFLFSLQAASAYYDPGLQRWLNRDPLAEPGFDTLRKMRFRPSTYVAEVLGSQNLYLLVHNFPMNHFDADGLFVWEHGHGWPDNPDCAGEAKDFYNDCINKSTCPLEKFRAGLHGPLLATEYGMMDPSNGPFVKLLAYLVGTPLRLGYVGSDVVQFGEIIGCAAGAAGVYSACQLGDNPNAKSPYQRQLN